MRSGAESSSAEQAESKAERYEPRIFTGIYRLKNEICDYQLIATKRPKTAFPYHTAPQPKDTLSRRVAQYCIHSR